MTAAIYARGRSSPRIINFVGGTVSEHGQVGFAGRAGRMTVP